MPVAPPTAMPGPLTVICAWCKRIITAVPGETAVTHTICAACLDRTMTHSQDGPLDPCALLPPADYFGDSFKP